MQAWESFLNELKKEMSEVVIIKWLRSLKIIKFDAWNLYLEAKDVFHVNWFEEHLREKVNMAFLNANNHPIKVHLTVKDEINKKKSRSSKTQKTLVEFTPDVLNDTNDFSSFYTDPKNDLCFKFLSELTGYATKENTEEKSDISLASFNPILIYGPSGSGKTHLLMACTKMFLKMNKKVFFVSSQKFTDHVVKAYRMSSLLEFRKTYRDVDILIVDDIHLLANKNATQEEFFHTFNALHTQGKQIILSSLYAPSHLKDIEKRLISRFEWGLTLTLEYPNSEGLKYIFEAKEKTYNLSFYPDSKFFLLDHFTSPKELQKAFEALILSATEKELLHPLDLSKIKHWLSNLIIEKENKALSPLLIITTVAEIFEIKTDDILGKAQTKECTLPRQIAMYLCRQNLKLPFKAIGKVFNRDHSTVITNVKFIEQNKNKETFYRLLLELKKKLNI